jgi:hypothetical protein
MENFEALHLRALLLILYLRDGTNTYKFGGPMH